MSSLSILFLFVAVVVIALLALNFLLAPRNPYLEKLSAFESGFHSFKQTRSQFHLSFFVFALIYLIFDLELILIFPYAVSIYENGLYGLIIMLIFTLIISIGFAYELGSGALQIDSRQNSLASSVKTSDSFLASSFIPNLNLSIIPQRLYFSHSISIRRVSTIRSSTSNNKFWKTRQFIRLVFQK